CSAATSAAWPSPAARRRRWPPTGSGRPRPRPPHPTRRRPAPSADPVRPARAGGARGTGRAQGGRSAPRASVGSATVQLLVTGAAGFIGANFTRHWVERHPGDGVVALDLLTYAGNRPNLAEV